MMTLISVALKNMFRNKRRSFTIIMTVMLGTGSLFLYHGFNYGIMNQYKYNTIRSRYGHGQINTHNYLEKVYEKPWEHWISDYDKLETFLKNQKEVDYIFPRVEFFAMLTNEKITVTGKGQGIRGEVESKFFKALNITEGKNLEGEADGIILGKGLAKSLDAKIGDRITVLANTTSGSLNGIDLYVTGIFHTGSKDFDDVVFRLPLDMAHTLLDTKLVESVAIGLHQDDQYKSLQQKVNDNFKDLDITPFEILDKVYYQHAIDFLQKQFDTIKIIILVIVILGIFNTVTHSILERKQEIGNLRANGESKKDIMTLLLLEGLFLGLLGGVLGPIMALILNNTLLIKGIYMPPSPGITRQFHVFIELYPPYAITTILLGVFSTVFGTFFAGIKIVRENIASLLRSN